MTREDPVVEELRLALRPTWVVPLAGGLLELLVAGVVVGLGVYYDSIERLPGPTVGLGIALLTGRWVLLARLQWAAAQRYLAATATTRREVGLRAKQAVARHGRAAVLQALESLDHPKAIEAAPPPRALPP